MQSAASLDLAINVFDATQPLRGDEIAAFYVERTGTPLMAIKTQLLTARGAPGKFVRMLFTGHSGAGKSTELNKLALEVKRQFFVVPVPMRDRAPLPTLN